MTLLVVFAGCGGGYGSARLDAVDDLEPDDPASIRQHARDCDAGDVTACNTMGIWLVAGTAGGHRSARGLEYLRHACAQHYQPACRIAADLAD
jgi:hypothetical protein